VCGLLKLVKTAVLQVICITLNLLFCSFRHVNITGYISPLFDVIFLIQQDIAMNYIKLKELQNLKISFKQIIVENGLEELDTTNPVVEMIAKFEVGPENKYSAFKFAEMLQENYLVCFQSLI